MKKRNFEENDGNEPNPQKRKPSKEKKVELLLVEEKKTGIEDLPKALILFLSHFFDLDSLVNFSSTNQRYKAYFSEFKKIYSFSRNNNFFKYFEKKTNLSTKKQFLKNALLKKEFGILLDVYENTLLHYASQYDSPPFEIVKYLIENKIDVNSKNKFNDISLHCAFENKNISFEIIKYLIENKSKINLNNSSRCTPLHYACKNKNISIEIIKYLIENKSDLNSTNTDDQTPLYYLSKNGKFMSTYFLNVVRQKKKQIEEYFSNKK